MTYDIDSILANRKNTNVVSAVITALNARRDACKSAKLVGREQDIYWLSVVHPGIFCDGIEGTLLNYGVAPLAFAVGGFRRIGAVEKASILRDALLSFGEPEPGRELPLRFELPPTSEQEKLFKELSHRFRDAKENFDELAVAYIEQHVGEFRSYGAQGGPAQPTDPTNGGPLTPVAKSGVTEEPPLVS